MNEYINANDYPSDTSAPNFTQQITSGYMPSCDYFECILDEMLTKRILPKFQASLQENRQWIYCKNKDVYFHYTLQALFPNLQTFEAGRSTVYYSKPTEFSNVFSGYNGEFMTRDQFIAAFKGNLSFLRETFHFRLSSFFTISDSHYSVNSEGTDAYMWGGSTRNESVHIPIYPLKQTKINTYSLSLLLLLQNGLMPYGLTASEEKFYNFIMSLVQKDEDMLEATVGGIILKGAHKQTAKSLLQQKFAEMRKLPALRISSEHFSAALCNVDSIRADLEPYNPKILTDPNGGHWDLWGELLNPSADNQIKINFQSPLVARNPLADLREDGIIGIDFGTKSTVVVFQENSEHTMPLRIGTGQLSKKIEASHYENPTVLEFINIEKFMDAYTAEIGRPATEWRDVTTSHSAFDSFLNSNSSQYYAYLYELKQWAGDKQRKIHLRDKKNRDVILSPYLQLGENDFDPIELYAYYIGLYINNMHNGIYIDYLLSYPVAYEKNVRDKLVESFTRGIKKSLPPSVLEDEEVMGKFRVTLGASEPVAYAICALEECDFQLEDDEKIYYGVFDFGGGTSDFDFGLYYESNERRYDYVIESFGSSGDKYLGGENLLELLAFEVFKKNQDLMRERGLTFELPPECKRFAGDELLISESQEAKLNMAQLKEQLRDLWERRPNYEKKFESGILKVSLFNNNGETMMNTELSVELEGLEQILRSRITTGVRNFFEGLIQAFNLPKDTDQVEVVHILLAGNSSKSVIFREVMDEYIEKYNQRINESTSDYDKQYFVVIPPLGTDEAKKFVEEQSNATPVDSIEQPTCKTGVAFGLVNCRQGGRIKLIREKEISEEIRFPFFIGYEKKQKFHTITDAGMDYQVWHELIDATELDFTVYYSKIPIARQNNLPISDVSRKRCRLLQVEPDANVYYRAVAPTAIEYVVATADGINCGNLLSTPVRVELGGA